MVDKRVKFNVEKIWSEGLCTGCGVCSAVCENNAVEMKRTSEGLYAPIVDASNCNECGLCIKICPGYLVDFDDLNKVVFDIIPEDLLLGNFLRCYVGYATNYKTRWNCASGGLVSTLLVFALQERIIDGAVVTRMSKEKPLMSEVVIARTAEEILEAAGSKYCPTPAGTAVKELLKGDGKYAFVGLPCHIHALRKMENLDKKLKNRIVLHLGLICKHNPTFTATEILIEKMGIRKNEVAEIIYRGGGWPGDMQIKMKDGREKKIPSRKFRGIIFSPFFTPSRCTMCIDATSELADISFGDAWLRELLRDKVGLSMIITRNEIGKRLLQAAKSKGLIYIQEISRGKVLEAHSSKLGFKKKKIMSRLKLLTLLGRNHPKYRTKTLKPSFLDYFTGIFHYICIGLSKNRIFYNFLKYAPFSIIKLFTIIKNFI